MYAELRAHLGFVWLALFGLCAIFAVFSDVFLTWQNILNILTASSTIGLLAIGAAFVIGASGLDLSVGSLMALSTIVAVLLAPTSLAGLPLIAFFCLVTGALVGALSGLIIGIAKIPAFIVTLSVLSLARGLALILVDGSPVYGLPEAVLFVGQGRLFGIAVPVVVFFGVGFLTHVLLGGTTFGRHTLAIGDNEKAARNAGIKVSQHKILLYAFSGLLAAAAGLLFMGRVNAADPSAGIMYELTAITAAIIGGTPLSGGMLRSRARCWEHSSWVYFRTG